MYHRTKKLPLNGKHGDGKFTTVDVDFFDAVSQYRWYMTKDGYVYRSQHISGSGRNRVKKNIALHREIAGAPIGKVVDHLDRNPLNNARANLRICTRSQNEANSPSRGGTSKYKGVSRNIGRGKAWQSGIKFQYKRIALGMFDTEKEAAKAYDKKAKELFGEFAYINLI